MTEDDQLDPDEAETVSRKQSVKTLKEIGINDFSNDYNERPMNDQFSMMSVLAQEFINYSNWNSDKFETFVDLLHRDTMIYETGSDEYLLKYRDLPIIDCNFRVLSFNFNGFEYSGYDFFETDMREWTRYDPAADRNESIDCQTFVEEYERFKKSFDCEGK